MSKERRKHTHNSKAKVVLEEVEGEATMAQLAVQYEVHAGQIQAWRKSWLEKAAGVLNGNQNQCQKLYRAIVPGSTNRLAN